MNGGNIMKKVIYVLAIIALVLSLSSCSKAVMEVPDTTVSANETIGTTIISTTTEPTTKQTTVTTTKQDTTITKKETTVITTKKVTTTRKQTTTHKVVETKPKTTTTTTQKVVSTCTNNDNHSMGVGNMGKWLNNRNEVQAYVSSVMESWNDKFRNGEITREEYYENCPSGYKSWSCSYCGKWTGNFTY